MKQQKWETCYTRVGCVDFKQINVNRFDAPDYEDASVRRGKTGFSLIYQSQRVDLQTNHKTTALARATCYIRSGDLGIEQWVPMTNPRDSQRSRLYRAENLAGDFTTQDTESLEVLQQWLDTVTTSTLWASFCQPLRVSLEWLKGHHEHSNAYYGTHAHANYDRQRIKTRLLNKRLMLHELAHIAVSSMHFAAHGAEFAGVYLLLVKEFLGETEFTKLAHSFTIRGIRYTFNLEKVMQVNAQQIRYMAKRSL